MSKPSWALYLCVLFGVLPAAQAQAQTYRRTEVITYADNTTVWVLGQVASVTCAVSVPASTACEGDMVSQTIYDSTYALPTQIKAFGKIRQTVGYDAAATVASGQRGTLKTVADGNAHVTTYTSWKRGIPQTITFPATTDQPTPVMQKAMVNDVGWITSVNDENNHKTCYDYDAMGRLTGITWPSEAAADTCNTSTWAKTLLSFAPVTSAEYGIPAGHWKQTTSIGNGRQVTYYDALWQPLVAERYDNVNAPATRSVVVTRYDATGRLTFQSYPMASLGSYASPSLQGSKTTYDALGRVTTVEQDSELGVLTTTTAYLSDATGPYTQATDPQGAQVRTWYQAYDQPSHDAPIKVVTPAGITQTIARDPYGSPLTITQSGTYGTESLSVTKAFVYDSHHRLCRTTEPESGDTVMGYDEANNLVWSVAGATLNNDGSCHPELAQSTSVITRAYDARNRLKTTLPPMGTQSTAYTYDALGHPTAATSGTSTWSATYNKRGLLTGESLLLVGQNPWAIGYTHDTYGHLSSIQYPDGESVGYAPDALGRATQVGSYLTNIGYYPNGEVAQATLGNGALYVADQNDRQLLSNFSYAKGSTINLSEDFTYDKNGNITQFTDLAGGPRNKTFGYDALNRLTSATAAGLWGTETYAYDPINNIRQRINGSQTTTYHYDSQNRLSSLTGAGTTSFGYDLRGNVTRKGGVALTFDQKNQLVSLPGISYAYDAAGRRVSKSPTGGSPTYSFYNQAGQLMYQVEPGLTKTTSFAYLGRKLVGRNESVALGAPGAVSFDANPNDGSYTVSWGVVSAATGYLLQERINGGSWTTVYTGSAASKALSGRAGGNYTYQARGCIGSTCGGWSLSATLGVRPALPTVTVPSGTINGSYTVSWTAPASSTGYDVQERLNSGNWTTIASDTTATSISRPGTTSGSYTYQVSAKNSHGTRGWAASSAVTVDTTYGVLPATPASITVPATSSGGIAVSWAASATATSYTLQQRLGTGSWNSVYTGAATNSTRTVTTSGSYTYQVQACNTSGCSAYKASSAVAVTIPPAGAPTLAVPATSSAGSYATSWTAVTDATSYTLQEQVGGGNWATIQSSSAISKAITGKGTGSYGYRVQACNAGGCGTWSSTKTIAVTRVPSPPAGLSAVIEVFDMSGELMRQPTEVVSPQAPPRIYALSASWSASADATSYTFQYCRNGGTCLTKTSSTTSITGIRATGTAYAVSVQACSAAGCSTYSAAVTPTVIQE